MRDIERSAGSLFGPGFPFRLHLATCPIREIAIQRFLCPGPFVQFLPFRFLDHPRQFVRHSDQLIDVEAQMRHPCLDQPCHKHHMFPIALLP